MNYNYYTKHCKHDQLCVVLCGVVAYVNWCAIIIIQLQCAIEQLSPLDFRRGNKIFISLFYDCCERTDDFGEYIIG